VPTDPVRVDRWIAVVLTLLAQWDIWSGSGSAAHRVGAAAVALAITAPIAVRRRWPAVVGTVVPALATFEYAILSGSSIAYPLANLFALYALAVWPPTRQFVIGVAVLVVIVLGSSALDGSVIGSAQ
jgi:hypothetical protein